MGLAEGVGVSRKTINTLENGVFIPWTVLALQLAKALDTTVEALFQLPVSQRQHSDAVTTSLMALRSGVAPIGEAPGIAFSWA